MFSDLFIIVNITSITKPLHCKFNPMKKLCLLIIIICSNFILLYGQPAEQYQTLILNDTFSHAQPVGAKIKPKNYVLKASKGFKLDCTNYDFTLIRTMNDGKNPDAIFIVAKAGTYIVNLNDTGETIVDRSTMRSLDKPKKKFTLFEKADTPIIGIGTLKIKNGAASMETYWLSLIEIQ